MVEAHDALKKEQANKIQEMQKNIDEENKLIKESKESLQTQKYAVVMLFLFIIAQPAFKFA